MVGRLDLGRVRRPTRVSLEFACKAAVATTLAIWLGDRIGLSDSYWAGICAVVASAGTIGASLGAAISRISATLVGLALGLVHVAFGAKGVLVSGATVFLALVVLAALSLDAGARLGAATTLIVTAIPGQNAVSDALNRGLNVPLCCAVAVAVGAILWPRRATDQLEEQMRREVRAAGELTLSAIHAYVGSAKPDGLLAGLGELEKHAPRRRAGLVDAAREPGFHSDRIETLRDHAGAVGELAGAVAPLVRVCAGGPGPVNTHLLDAELETAAEGIVRTTRAIADSTGEGELGRNVASLSGACAALDGAFARARARRATVKLSTDEIARMLSVVRGVHEVSTALERICDSRH
jgi:uncharacterized membrane protein YccC